MPAVRQEHSSSGREKVGATGSSLARAMALLAQFASSRVPLIVGCITFAGLVLRLPSFNDALFGDEISTHFIVFGHGLGRVMDLVQSDQEVTPPLFFLLAWATKGVLGSPSQSIRLVSLVTGVAVIPLTYLLGLRTVGKRAGLVGAACVALSPFMILLSTYARAFMLVLFLALLSTLAMLRALDTGRTRWWVVYGVCSCAAFYTHYTVVYVLIAQFVWAFWSQPRARRALLATNIAAALAVLPWLGGFLDDIDGPSFLPSFSVDRVKSVLESASLGHGLVLPTAFVPGQKAVLLALAGVAVGLIGLVLLARTEKRSWWRVTPRTAFVLVLALAAPTLLTLQSVAGMKVLAPVNLSASWPAFALALGVVTVRSRNPFRMTAVVLLLGAFAVGGVKMLGEGAQRPNMDQAVAFVKRVGAAGDPIVSEPFFANPLSSLDVELRDRGLAQRFPVLRLRVPSLAKYRRALSGPDPQLIVEAPVPTPEEVARKAVKLARHGTIFLVSDSSIAPRLERVPDSEVSRFVDALPPRFRVVDRMRYPGWAPFLTASVYVFQDVNVVPDSDK